MSKTITLRVSEAEYKDIVKFAKAERRPISNFIIHSVLNAIANMFTVDDKEMKEILADKKLLKSLEQGHRDAKLMKGKFVA